ncbi:hypothetical protein FGG78_24150 [Thioclava sp. BHET1]|nr:hypothetical protein FGG78_24150 [Thioclava sp. BHET1]
MERLLRGVAPEQQDLALALAALPMQIRGFGPVKLANMHKAAAQRADILAALDAGPRETAQAAE